MEKNPQNDLVYPGERVDDLQNGLYVIQNPEKFCFGMDAVLLSGFADIRQNEKVLDMGTGTGIIPFLLKMDFLQNNDPHNIYMYSSYASGLQKVNISFPYFQICC